MKRTEIKPGDKFGKLTILSHVDGPSRTKWNCLCECGNKKTVLDNNLKSGNTVSCGCGGLLNLKNNKKDISGQKFGFLTVIGDVGKRSKRGGVLWECNCECGNIIYLEARFLKKKMDCGCVKRKEREDKKKLPEYIKNKKKQKREYRFKNKDKINATKRKEYQNNIHNARKKNRRYQRKRYLTHGGQISVAKRLLTKNTQIKTWEIPKEIIELKVLYMELNRLRKGVWKWKKQR